MTRMQIGPVDEDVDHLLSYLFEGTGEINHTSPPQSPNDSPEKNSKNGYNSSIITAA
eukprot:CAMPEP_0194288452 /NCGR_PEP_ID=MMETSP0169-20130528/36845_1 /TAXON_ID=218684 /ORGANISM="Corethron pennatum, Strain L29A3" /LENGTH=56 /DNA_ID=CAMNT_0039035455 /DNA_START=25 /DNA_END=192 /DNA_ORIENTATION=-